MKYLAISLFLHFLLFFSLSYSENTKKPNSSPPLLSDNKPKSSQQIRLKVNKPEPKKMALIKHATVKKEMAEKPCDEFYYGIGYMGDIMADINGRCSIAELAFNGPLHRAGVVPGDTIESIDGKLCPGRGTDGSLITVTIYHQDIVRVLILKREKICEN